MSEIASAYLTLIPSLRGAKGRIESELSGVSASAGQTAGKRMGGGMVAGLGSSLKGAIGAFGLVLGAQAVAGFLSGAVGAASDLVETGSKVGVVFGSAAGQVQQFASGGAKTLGQTRLAVLDASSTFGVFGKSAGLAGGDLAKFATGFAGLSTDLASFYNTSPEDAVQAIGAALRGESEPIRRFGVLLDDATLRQEALRLGLIKNTKTALTPQQRVLAAQAAIYRQTGDAQGDFARTSGGLANQQRILGAQWEDFKATLGRGLLPVVTTVVSTLNERLFPAMEAIGDVIGPVVGAIGDFFKAGGDGASALAPLVEFFQTRLLPAFSGIYDAVSGLVTTVWPIVSEFAAGMVERFTPLLPAISAVFGTIGSIITGAMDLVATVVTTVTGWIKSAWDQWGAGLMDTVTTVFGAFLGIIQPALDVVRGIIKAVTSAIRGDWSGAWAAIKGVVASAWDLIKATVSGALSIVKQLMSTAWSAIKTVAGTAWAGITTAVSTAVTGLVDFVKGIPGRIVSALGDFGSLLWNKGVDLVSGLIDGIASMGGRLVSWLKQWVLDHIPGPIASILGIASPSKVMAREVGRHIPTGIMAGMDATAPALDRAMRALVQPPSVGSGGLVFAGAGGGGNTYNVAMSVAARDLDEVRKIEAVLSDLPRLARTMVGVRA